MTITPLAFMSDDDVPAELAADSDLKVLHPRLSSSLWDVAADYSAQIEEAFNRLLLDLKGKGYDTALIPNNAINRAWAKRAVIHRALAMIFLDFTDSQGDRWSLLRTEHDKEYLAMLDNAELEYDADGDGTTSTDETAIGRMRFLR
jgi:hypothetical protein